MTDYLPWTDGEILGADPLNHALGYAATITQEDIDVTDSATDTTFNSPLQFCLVKNIGSDTVFLKTDATATTSDYPLVSGATIVLNGGSAGLTTLYHICDTGETCTLRVLGTY